MLFDSTQRNIFAIITSCLGILLLLWGGYTLWSNLPVPQLPEHAMPLQQLLAYYLYGSPVWAAITGAAATLLIALLLYRLNEEHLFVTNREPLLAIVFTLLASAFASLYYITGVHLALLFLIFMFGRLFRAYRCDYAFSDIFTAAIFLSIATLFHAPSAYFLLAYIIALRMMKSLQWRDLLVAIAGLLVPYLFALFYYAFATGNWQQPFSLLALNLKVDFPLMLPAFTATQWVYIVYLAVIVLIAIFKISVTQPVSTKIKTIRINSSFIYALFISLIPCIFYRTDNYANLLLLYLPATVIIAQFFGTIKHNRWANILFILLIASVISIQIPCHWYTQTGQWFTLMWNFIIDLF